MGGNWFAENAADWVLPYKYFNTFECPYDVCKANNNWHCINGKFYCNVDGWLPLVGLTSKRRH
eukprot:NODE_5057_length_325_cov_183.014493_g4446_i0.p1 GENE.NODE_5057_length_325_cov_183.014493_g4446_i0~~NODE_5057_length_325_cov_183.014493_g4446_i0.p1  ORF type:complete len:72 (-),score=15.53 NODE_5057_length_325_cov_183.014493_g4446_i0:110-298(-)